MSISSPLVSVIIPSHNRRASLGKALDALSLQTYPIDHFEVIVVLDGCRDGSHEMLSNYPAPFTLRIIEQEQNGSSVARNHGADQATGELLIFLDDDIEATPGLIQAHVDAYYESNARVVIGYYPPALSGKRAYLPLELQGWWEAMFEGMHQPGRRFWYTDMLSGNFSIPSKIFYSIGGFNLNMPVHEDYELGVRLIRAGVVFAFEKAAMGLHHEQPDIQRTLKRKFHEGIADIRLSRLYPELIPTLMIWRLLKYSLLPSRVLYQLSYRCPSLGGWIASTALKALTFFEKAHLLGLWRKTIYGLMGYWYWKGVAQELPTIKSVKDFMLISVPDASSDRNPEIDLDLSPGLDHAEQVLDQLRPNGARILIGEKIIGIMPPEAGAERLRGEHLRPFLINQFAFYMQGSKVIPTLNQLPTTVEEIIAILQEIGLPSIELEHDSG